MRRGVVFDMDDTLVWEREYVRSGFQAVAQAVASRARDEEAVFDMLWGWFESGRRGDLFDLLLDARVLPGVTVPDLIDIYRTHTPTIALSKEMVSLLKWVRPLAKLAVISDGPLASQEAKAQALGLGDTFDVVVLSDVWGREHWKPHPRPFQHVMRALDIDGADLIYIGDNPAKDFIGARALGWHTVRLRAPEQLRYALEPESERHRADVDVGTISALRDILDRFLAGHTISSLN